MSQSRQCLACLNVVSESVTGGSCPTCGGQLSDTPKKSQSHGDFELNLDSRTQDFPHISQQPVPSTVPENPQLNGSLTHSQTPEIANYHSLTYAGKGGMGYVYRGIQRGIERVVAIKIMKPSFAFDENSRERFENEIRALGKIDHPGIVRVYDYGASPSGPYFSMDFVDGVTLSQWVLNNGLPEPRAAVRIIREVAEPLQLAHEKGILHRDLKPNNVMLDQARRVKLTDFGLAKHEDDTASLTPTQAAIGTPPYMAYEQAIGAVEKFDERTDVYGLGATLFFLLTGKSPRKSGLVAAIIHQYQEKATVTVREHCPEICPILDSIVQKSLAKDQTQRFATVAQFAEELRRWSVGEPTDTRPPTLVRKWSQKIIRSRMALPALAVGLIIVVTAMISSLLAARPVSTDDGVIRSPNGDTLPFRVLHKGKNDTITVDAEGTLTVGAFDLCFLEYTAPRPSPPFRFHAKIRHEKTQLQEGRVGLFFGHHKMSGPKGIYQQSGQLVFNDLLSPRDRIDISRPGVKIPNPRTENIVELEFITYSPAETGNMQKRFWHHVAGSESFAITGRAGDRWRTTELLIDSESVTGSMDDRIVGPVKNTKYFDIALDHQHRLGITNTESSARDEKRWTHDGAIGILVVQGTASISGVSLTSIP